MTKPSPSHVGQRPLATLKEKRPASKRRARAALVAHWHGHGTIDLPFDHRSSRGTCMGYCGRTPRCRLYVHPACRGELYNVKLRSSSPPAIVITGHQNR
jgi:hypothetical protein